MRDYYAENREQMRDSMRAWREKNGDKHRAKAMEYHYKNRDALLAKQRAKRKENAAEINARRRDKKFGLAPGAYQAMLLSQDGCCAVCGEKRKLVVDHNHKTGAVRALLCSPCNTAIGLLKEDPTRFHSAVQYLAKKAFA